MRVDKSQRKSNLYFRLQLAGSEHYRQILTTCLYDKAMQGLLQHLLVHVFSVASHLTSTDLDQAMYGLATTCKILHTAFQDLGVGVLCKQRALPKLAGATGDAQPGRDIFPLRLQPCKTIRLVKWLESGHITMHAFWQG